MAGTRRSQGPPAIRCAARRWCGRTCHRRGCGFIGRADIAALLSFSIFGGIPRRLFSKKFSEERKFLKIARFFRVDSDAMRASTKSGFSLLICFSQADRASVLLQKRFSRGAAEARRRHGSLRVFASPRAIFSLMIRHRPALDRKSVVTGKSVDLGGRPS